LRLALHWRSLEPEDVDLESLLDVAAGAGFSGVQASRAQIDAFARRSNSRLVRAIAAAGLCQTATWSGVDLEAPEGDFAAQAAQLDGFVRRARAMVAFGVGAPAAVVAMPRGPVAEGPPRRRLAWLAKLLGAAGLALLLDPADPRPGAAQSRRPLGPEERGAEIASLAGWLRAAPGPAVGAVVDLWRWAGLPDGAADLSWLRGVPLLGRLADAPDPPPPEPEDVPRLPPGPRRAALAAAVARLRRLGHDGYWELEVRLPARDAEGAAGRSRRAAQRVLEEALRL
jgi:sugar phosphate isomerase/epimerase